MLERKICLLEQIVTIVACDKPDTPLVSRDSEDGTHVICLAGRRTLYVVADSDDQRTWMIRRGSDEAVLRPVPWQLRANYRAERSVFVADGDPVFRSAFDGTKCRGIEDKIATSSRDTYRVSSIFGFKQVHNIDRHTTRKTQDSSSSLH